jgi:hypothetical protein
MKINELSQRTEASIAHLRQKLSQLDQLSEKAKSIELEIEKLRAEEQNILAGEDTDARKLSALLKVRASIDIQAANLDKVKAAIVDVEDHACAAAECTVKYFSAIRDFLLPVRKAKVLAQLRDIFDSNALLMLEGMLGAAIAVKEVELATQFPHMSLNNVLGAIANCRKLSAIADTLLGFLRQEDPEAEAIVGDFVPVVRARPSQGPAFVAR